MASKNTCCVEALVAKATAAVLEVQVIQARHIAESDDAAMSRMEGEMAASEAAARKALDSLKGLLPPAAGPQLAAAAAALDRFKAINAELVTLSRRNSNVRSLALSLGRKRTVTAECDDILHALEDHGTQGRHQVEQRCLRSRRRICDSHVRCAIAGPNPTSRPASSAVT